MYASDSLYTTGGACFSLVASCLKMPILDHLAPLLTLQCQAFGHRGHCIGDILARVFYSAPLPPSHLRVAIPSCEHLVWLFSV